MTVLYSSRTAAPADVETELGRGVVALDELLATSDIVSLHCPLVPETRGLIDAAALARMKPTAVLVNTSRGPVIDQAALAVALRTGAIAAPRSTSRTPSRSRPTTRCSRSTTAWSCRTSRRRHARRVGGWRRWRPPTSSPVSAANRCRTQVQPPSV